MFVNNNIFFLICSQLAFGGETYVVRVGVQNFGDAAYGAALKVDIPEGVKLRKVKDSAVRVESVKRKNEHCSSEGR